MNIKKGSVWRRWDLHVHSPFSELNNQFGDDWDNYVKELFNRAIKNDIYAIGITDYFSIEGYKKLKTEYLENDEKLKALFEADKEKIDRIKQILILPNIEFRLKLFVGDNRVNFHVLFSEEIEIKDIEENFLHDLDFVCQGDPDDEDEKWKLKIPNLKDLGKRLKDEHDKFKNDTDLFVGMKNAVVDDSQISAILTNKKSKFKDKYFLIVNPDEDLSDIDWNSQDHLARKIIIQKCHCLFASNPKTIEWALCKKGEDLQQFLKEFKALKPCIWGSDAHDFSKIFKPDEERNNWIKADLTFEGLRQILFEPEERVSIQSDNPDERVPYLLIDSAKFIPGTSSALFTTNKIELNQSLNSVIGGKSSGKSLLLYYIAKTANPAVVAKATGKEPLYDFELDDNFDFEITWSDGKKNRLREVEGKRTRQITYIPQLFINNLVEENNNENFDELVLNILHQNQEFKFHFEEFSKRKEILQNDAESAVLDFLTNYNSIKRTSESIVKLGDPKAVKQQIDKIKKEISDLTQSSNLMPKEVQKYQGLSQKIEECRKELLSLETEINNLTLLQSYVDEGFQSDIQDLLLDQIKTIIGEDTIEESGKPLNKVVDNIHKDLVPEILKSSVERFKIIDSHKKSKQKLLNGVKALSNEFKPLSEKIKNQEKLKKLQESLSEQQKIIDEIDGLSQKKKALRDQLKSKFEEIWKVRNSLNQSYEDLLEKISTLDLNSISNEINLEVNKVFSEEDFNKLFSPMVDLRTIKSHLPDNYSETTSDIINVNSNDFLKELFKKILKSEIKLRAGNEIQDALTRIVRDYFKLKYNLIYKNDEISKMSPGKRGLVLLQLILHLSNSKEPILIDQPEDNLDNRTIYQELNKFIREKKKSRQIIMVTHNPNLVVSTDAENVIVANQSGQSLGKDNRHYQFEYVSGALESSFSDPTQSGVLYQKGIREHVCEVLEGGEEAFKMRQKKYSFW